MLMLSHKLLFSPTLCEGQNADSPVFVGLLER